MIDFDGELRKIEDATLAAGAALVREIASGVAPDRWVKADKSFVSSLDIKCEEIILSSLSGSFPIVSEENVASHSFLSREKSAKESEAFYTVDPIDGTSTFLHFKGSLGGQVGFGPIVGLVVDGRVMVSTFFSVTERCLYSAMRDHGVSRIPIKDDMLLTNRPSFSHRTKLERLPMTATLQESVLLFYIGGRGEGSLIDVLKSGGHIMNCYRFGGFGNDCSRLARGLESLQLQFAVKAWDFAATLFLREAGYAIVVEPVYEGVSYDDWSIAAENPIVAGSPSAIASLATLFKWPQVRPTN